MSHISGGHSTHHQGLQRSNLIRKGCQYPYKEVRVSYSGKLIIYMAYSYLLIINLSSFKEDWPK